MKQILLHLFLLFLLTFSLNAQNIGINNSGATPDPSAMLDVESTNSGILIPRMTTSQRKTINNPAMGLLVYDTDLALFYFYNGSLWQDISGGFFTKDGTVLRLAQDENSTDFLFGRTDKPLDGQSISDKFILYDNSKFAFRGGQLSNSDAWSPENTGNSSFAYGFNLEASGYGSFATGFSTAAQGIYTIVGGKNTLAPSGYEVALGRYNTDYTPIAPSGWNNNDRLFVIGNGSMDTNRKDAFTIMKNGDATLAGPLTMTNGSDSYTIPNTVGLNNQVLRIDGSGDLIWSDDDWSETNELQSIGLSGSNLSITSKNTIDLGDLSGLWSEDEPANLFHTENSISIGTANKLGNVNIYDATKAELNITTTTSGISQINFLENSLGTSGMTWRYNGAHNYMELLSISGGIESSSHLYVQKSDGAIAIGSDRFATGYKMSVDGKVACEEVLVELSGSWPDYVFAQDYDLRSIEELEEYIDKEKHLPGIAPASEIEEDGIKLGEMQKSMMEKVEELSLYIIQLNKRNIELQERILALEKSK